jgi:hypothetical protein
MMQMDPPQAEHRDRAHAPRGGGARDAKTYFLARGRGTNSAVLTYSPFDDI